MKCDPPPRLVFVVLLAALVALGCGDEPILGAPGGSSHDVADVRLVDGRIAIPITVTVSTKTKVRPAVFYPSITLNTRSAVGETSFAMRLVQERGREAQWTVEVDTNLVGGGDFDYWFTITNRSGRQWHNPGGQTPDKGRYKWLASKAVAIRQNEPNN